MSTRRRHGDVWLSANRHGLWAWVEDGEGNVLAELDFPQDHAADEVREAITWALDNNREIREDRRREDASYDERAEWRANYTATRGVS